VEKWGRWKTRRKGGGDEKNKGKVKFARRFSQKSHSNADFAQKPIFIKIDAAL